MFAEISPDNWNPWTWNDMRRIAEACGMSASGLYKHFPSKEDLFSALVEPTVEGFFNLQKELESAYYADIE